MLEDLDLPFEQQDHSPLAFLISAFKSAQLRWSTFEKEAYAIYQVFTRLDYLSFTESPVHISTDHRNLLFVFSPHALEPALGRNVVSKVQSWALHLSKYQHVIEHIDGSENVFANILTRWVRGYRAQSSARKVAIVKLVDGIVSSSCAHDFSWPDFAVVRDSQTKFAGVRLKNSTIDANGIVKIAKSIWIPDQGVDLQFCLLVIAHCGLSGHCGNSATLADLRQDFRWTSIVEHVKQFVQSCVHYVVFRAGERIPLPLGTTVHGSRLHEVVHFDFLYMGSSNDGFKYLLLIKDNLSPYVWLCTAKNANAEAVAKNLSRWIASFTVMDTWVSDEGSHFKNNVMK